MGFAATGEPTNEGWLVGGEGGDGGFVEVARRGVESGGGWRREEGGDGDGGGWGGDGGVGEG